MGVRKEASASASVLGNRYLSLSTASSGQYRSLLMWRSSPVIAMSVTLSDVELGGLAFAVEEFGRVLSGECDAFGYLTHELHDLGDVVVILAVARAGGRIE